MDKVIVKKIQDKVSLNGGMRCLVVESDPLLRDLLERHLRPLGFEVLGTDNGRHAILLQATNPVDLMILHWRGKIVAGAKVLTAMSIVCEKLPKVIVMTGGNVETFHFDVPVSSYLFKPFEARHVMDAIWKAIGDGS